jgi:hypothetical protein
MITIKRTSVPMGTQRRIRKQRMRALTKSFVELIVGTLLMGAVWAMVLFALLSPCGATMIDAEGNRHVYQCSLSDVWGE